MDFALLATDRAMVLDDPHAQFEEAMEIADDAEAIAALRGLAGREDSPELQDALGRRLMRSGDPEGRAMLERLADDNPDVVDFLAGCFDRGCDEFRGDPLVADAWSERAAGMGAWMSLGMHIGKLAAAGNATDAWAWALYRLELARLGCFEVFRPQSAWLTQAAQSAFAMQSMLSSAQQAAGRAAAGLIAGTWQARATARFACG